MAEAISLDLRKRIVAAYEAGEGTYLEIAQRFKVGEATVSRLLRRCREHGGVEPSPHAGGNPPHIAASQYGELEKLVAEKPDRTVEELRSLWQVRYGVELSRSAMQRALLKAGLTWKKTLPSVGARARGRSRKTRSVHEGGRDGTRGEDNRAR